MEALQALLDRVSTPLLQEPGPTTEQLDAMFAAALRAPDHGAMRPWRFLVVEGEARNRLGELFLSAAVAKNPDLPQVKQDKLRNAPLRAPIVVVVIAKTTEGHKVPVIEQQISAGCAAQNILHAAYAQGIGAMWRTGEMSYERAVLEGLGLAENEEVTGYIYLGTPQKERSAASLNKDSYVSHWEG